MPSPSPRHPAVLSIGELSRHTKVNIETIRYYERIKMLPAPPRTTSGRRVYGLGDRRTLAFIRRARELGFTLGEIRALLALSGSLAALAPRLESKEAAATAAALVQVINKAHDIYALYWLGQNMSAVAADRPISST